MTTNTFSLNITQPRLTIGWILLALASLIIAGLLTILIVLSRTPVFQEIIPWIDFFHTALVIHVDLTVLVWFLAFAGVFWSLNSTNRCLNCGWLALILSVIGTVIISIVPFLGEGNPLMNNYIPVLQTPLFFVGLGIFGVGIIVLVIRSFIALPTISLNHEGALRFGLFTALITVTVAILAFIWSYIDMPKTMEKDIYYYEVLFWGGGHILQFTYTQLMLVAWLWLASISGAILPLTPRITIILFALSALPVLSVPFIYFAYDVNSPNHRIAFTWLMQYGGLSMTLLGLAIVFGIMKGRATLRPERMSLVFSILLFFVGGVIGFLISGSNVTVPAHYHGSIIAITLAFMGMTYYLIPQLGFRKISAKSIKWQSAIYGTGQLLHILGLAWSGGYGVQRKTAGGEQGLESLQQIAGMRLMGLGGMIAIIGGIMFLVIVFRAMRKKEL